ncbi:MAG: hypothetical protein ACUVQG_14030, partial [Thermogutta sp.]
MRLRESKPYSWDRLVNGSRLRCGTWKTLRRSPPARLGRMAGASFGVRQLAAAVFRDSLLSL